MESQRGERIMSVGSGYDEYAFVADLYDHVGPYRSRPDVAFFLNEAVNAGSPVVELGCGTGRVLIPIARAGVEIVGVDSSPHMLSVCRERLGREPEALQSRARPVDPGLRRLHVPRQLTPPPAS